MRASCKMLTGCPLLVKFLHNSSAPPPIRIVPPLTTSNQGARNRIRRLPAAYACARRLCSPCLLHSPVKASTPLRVAATVLAWPGMVSSPRRRRTSFVQGTRRRRRKVLPDVAQAALLLLSVVAEESSNMASTSGRADALCSDSRAARESSSVTLTSGRAKVALNTKAE